MSRLLEATCPVPLDHLTIGIGRLIEDDLASLPARTLMLGALPEPPPLPRGIRWLHIAGLSAPEALRPLDLDHLVPAGPRFPLQQLGSFDNIRTVGIRAGSPDDVEQAMRLDRLTDLTVPIKVDARKLRNLPASLRCLRLVLDGRVSLRNLPPLDQLETLSLELKRLRGDDLRALADAAPRLRRLLVMTDAVDLEAITRFRRLEALEIELLSGQPSGISSALGGLADLRSLSVTGSAVIDDIQPIAALAQLRALEVSTPPQRLYALTSLKTLRLRGACHNPPTQLPCGLQRLEFFIEGRTWRDKPLCLGPVELLRIPASARPAQPGGAGAADALRALIERNPRLLAIRRGSRTWTRSQILSRRAGPASPIIQQVDWPPWNRPWGLHPALA